MSEPSEGRGLVRSNKARWIAFARLAVVAAAPLLLVILITWTPRDRLDALERLGLVQPPLAALVALIVVLAMRLSWGRFAHETRKGASSASSAAIAVRLWIACFALLLAGMLLAALVARLPDSLLGQRAPAKPVEVQVDVKPSGASNTVSVNVSR